MGFADFLSDAGLTSKTFSRPICLDSYLTDQVLNSWLTTRSYIVG